jgi:hypothetical protein
MKFQLIVSTGPEYDKRSLPRLPLKLVTFRPDGRRAMAVNNISHKGMQLAVLGESLLKIGQKISGELHWRHKRLRLTALVRWERESALGLEFILDSSSKLQLDHILGPSFMVQGLRHIHSDAHQDWNVGQWPQGLDIWLKGDGPVQLLVWRSSDMITRFQCLILDHFIEWNEGEGLRTGTILWQEGLSVGMNEHEDIHFKLHAQGVDQEALSVARQMLEMIRPELLNDEMRSFLRIKLGSSVARLS